MKIKYLINRRFLFVVILLLFVSYLINFEVSLLKVKNYLKKTFIYQEINENKSKLTKQVLGDENYYTKIIEKQFLDPGSKEKSRIIKTANFNILIDSINLNENGNFANIGGSFLIFKDNFLVVDRLGSFFWISDHLLSKINLPKIPNNIKNYILNSNIGHLFNDTFLRVISLAYDQKSNNLLVGYTRYINDECNKFIISKIFFTGPSVYGSHWTDIFVSECFPTTEPSHGGGGKMLIKGDNLYFTVGYPDSVGFDEDKNFDKEHIYNTQDLEKQSGKIFSLNLIDNYVSMISYGHRNSQGLVFYDDMLYETEHGPQGGDEINLIHKGKNYGWPFHTFGARYNKFDYDVIGKKPLNFDYEEPLYSFVPSIGISPIDIVTNFHSEWNGDLIVGGLSSRSIHRIKLSKKNTPIFVEDIFLDKRIRDIKVKDKKLYLLTDDSKLLSLSIKEN